MPTSRNVIQLSFSAGKALLYFCLAGQICFAQESGIAGFTEPTRKVEIAALETGRLNELHFEVGDYIEKGELIGRLDNEIQMARLKIARHLSDGQGELVRSEAELRTKQSIVDHYKKLVANGFAQRKELLRASLDLHVAEAALLAHKEKSIEYEKRFDLSKIELSRREIRSTISGRVTMIHRRVGEFVSIAKPALVTIVQTNPMRAKFQVPMKKLKYFQAGDDALIRIGTRTVNAKIERVGLIATSGTVPLLVSIPNQDQELIIGQQCVLLTDSAQLASSRN